MLERRQVGEVPQKPHTLFVPESKKNIEPYSEYVFTRNGFAGGFSILYTKFAPTSIKNHSLIDKNIESRVIGELPAESGPVMRRHIKSWQCDTGSSYLESRTALFKNDTCRISTVRGNMRGSYQGLNCGFANWNADELFFVYEGSGTVLTPYGNLIYNTHDYILIPKGVPYSFDTNTENEFFLMEGTDGIEIPGEYKNNHGQLKLEAPYTHRDFLAPKELLSPKQSAVFNNILSLQGEHITLQEYAQSPYDVIGWDGSVYPMTFNIHDYLPKTGKIHLPPNLHMTFKTPSFVVCSFVPRMVDYLEGAIPCPYPHANVDCDEILYYVKGNFTSRKGISERSISYHPTGLVHGPQPGNYLKSVGSKTTDELAVMVDTFKPLRMTKAASKSEDSSYPKSWA